MDRKVTKATEMLKAARLKKGYSQQQVAVIASVHVRQYQRLEYGERARKSINMRLGLAVCAILEINPFDIVDWLPDGWETVTREKNAAKSA